MRRLVPMAAVVFVAVALRAQPAPHLPPLEYVAGKLRQHPIVIVGEGHWIRHDVELMRDLIPTLAKENVAFASETLPSDWQTEIDALIAAPSWNEARGMKVMRAAAWPYREYLDILRAAWKSKATVIALGPPRNWREKKIDYDRFMADRIIAAREKGQKRFLIYCGMHHAFTRYYQPELDLEGNAYAFMDRMGNMLLRQYGSRVFLITLHKPVWCGEKEPWGYCLPLEGEIDCTASDPAGFDVGSFAERRISPLVYYARGYRSLRLGDMTDGIVWFKPVEQYQLVMLIPLAEFAPDEEALAEVIANPPFGGKDLTRAKLEEQWTARANALASPMTSRGWTELAGWRGRCQAR